MRSLLCMITWALACLAQAKTALDAAIPSGPESAPATTSSGFPMLQLVVVAGILYALFRWVGPKVLAWTGSKVSATVGSEIKIEESATLAQGSLYVVSVRGKSLLIGATANGVNLISELEAPSAEPAFFEHVDAAMGNEDPKSRLDHLLRGLR